jgi:hypothetical protein
VARITKLILVLPALALMLAACGTVHAGTASPGATVTPTAAATATASASPTSSTAPAGAIWRTIPGGMNTTTIRLADSGRVVLIPVQAPFGDRACLRDFTTRLTAFSSALAYVTITYQVPLTYGPDGLAGYNCPIGPVKTVAIKLPAPLGSRQVILNHVVAFWSTSTTVLTQCDTGGTRCTHYSDKPPQASCSDVSYGWAMAATAPPQGSVYGELGCDGRWLVLNVGWPGGATGCDGPSCQMNFATTHWFFRASKQGWIVVANSLTAGCTRVHQEAPQFPTALCAGLPAVGPDAG